MAYVAAALSTLAGAFVSLCMVVLLLAGSPNSSPRQMGGTKAWMGAVLLAAGIGLVGASWAMIAKRPWTAAGIGGAPGVFCVLALMLLMFTQRT